eukprot:374921-Amphidinium_carterae.1
MAHGGPVADPQVSGELSTVRIWHRRILAGRVKWPLEARLWNDALRLGRGKGPIRNLKQMANRLGWVPDVGESKPMVLMGRSCSSCQVGLCSSLVRPSG